MEEPVHYGITLRVSITEVARDGQVTLNSHSVTIVETDRQHSDVDLLTTRISAASPKQITRMKQVLGDTFSSFYDGCIARYTRLGYELSPDMYVAQYNPAEGETWVYIIFEERFEITLAEVEQLLRSTILYARR